MRKRPIKHEHPALALMRSEARGILVRFQTDLSVHDTLALSKHAPTDAFAWILHPGATWFAFMGPEHRNTRFAGVFVGAYGPDECRFYFWDGSTLARKQCAIDLDEHIEQYEESLRERRRAGELADRGVA